MLRGRHRGLPLAIDRAGMEALLNCKSVEAKASIAVLLPHEYKRVERSATLKKEALSPVSEEL